MSDNTYSQSAGVASDIFALNDSGLFQRVLRQQDAERKQRSVDALPSNEGNMSLFKTVRSNIVQSIRAFRVTELADEATQLGHHFLYANCAAAQTKAEVLETIATSFLFLKQFGKNYDALYDCLTDLVHRAVAQPGFVIVLEGLPATQKFDKEARETLLDVFREAAEFWAERKVNFRVFYSFA
jgi:RNAse (barnase) inhibitor barstar